jgi:hypothetical protein
MTLKLLLDLTPTAEIAGAGELERQAPHVFFPVVAHAPMLLRCAKYIGAMADNITRSN